MIMMKELLNKKTFLFGVAALITSALAYIYKNRKRRIFVSYYHAEDSKYKNTLKMWSKNSDFNLDFYDHSADVSIKSTNEGVIRQVISTKINKSNLVICIVGKNTHSRKWVNWELEKAKKLNKRIIAVKIKSTYKSPEALLNSGTKFINSFNKKDILNAINRF
ncbi:MAG: TIR domain-containing protein [Sulfurimonas sp.]|nr:TIR domain-containing protein [Sulfurimonas sp.]